MYRVLRKVCLSWLYIPVRPSCQKNRFQGLYQRLDRLRNSRLYHMIPNTRYQSYRWEDSIGLLENIHYHKDRIVRRGIK